MGKALHDKHKEVQDLFDKATNLTKRDIRKIVFEGPKDVLDKTSNTQVAILVVSLGILAVYLKKHREQPDYVTGHSVGEITAAVTAGAITEEDAIALTFERGLAMEQVGAENPGGMAAILGVPDAEVEELAREHGIYVANYNIPDSQAVVSGKQTGIQSILETMGRRGRELAVTIAAHSPEMAGAVQRVEHKIESISYKDLLDIPAIANRTGQLAAKLSDLELPKQLIRSVRWGQGIEAALDEGATEFTEFSPATVLSDMVRRHLKNKGRTDVKVHNASELLDDN